MMRAPANPMLGPNPLKLGVFALNSASGLTLTTVPERWPARWDEIVEVARLADAAGFEFILPLARWLGFQGETNAREHCFESLTHAAALAGTTERIALFATVHTPFVHPVFAAKAMTTLDHASNGRAGLNIVCGWNEPEYAAFGIAKQENVYALGLEWYTVFARIVAGEGPFDFDGRYFQLRGVMGHPPTVQQPRPVTLSAAFSEIGRDFAATTSDYIFTVFDELDAARRHIADIRARAAARGRGIGACTTCHVVCRPTQAEADAYYEHFAVTCEDRKAVDRHMHLKKTQSRSHEPSAYERYRKRFAAGAGSYPLVGSPDAIAAEMGRIHAIGYTGIALTFVNYKDELPYFIDTVLPRLRAAGLRHA